MRFVSTCHELLRTRRVACAAAGAAVALATAVVLGQDVIYRGGTELVVLQVSVVDQQRRLVANLNQSDFAVYEEGTPQTLELFATAATPLDLMLLLDTSSSMYGRMATTQEAAINFVRTLKTDDRASIVLFNHTVRVAHPLTNDIEALESAIRSAVPAGRTALHEALYVSLRELARTRRGDESTRRQALVVMTDGDDNSSMLAFDDVLQEARRGAVTVFTIVPSMPEWGPALDFARRQRPSVPFNMRDLAEETGGRAFAPRRIEELDGIYGEIAEELSRQYWLAYVPKPAASGYRRVSVRILSQPSLRARSRNGYYASASRSNTSPTTVRRSQP